LIGAQNRLLLAAALLGVAGQSEAQTLPQPGAAQGGVVLNGEPASVAKTCVQVEIAGQTASAFDCLNQQLQDQALAASGQNVPAAPLGAGSAPNTVGLFNPFGVAEQYGKNFGVSVIPYRPPPPVFSSGVH